MAGAPQGALAERTAAEEAAPGASRGCRVCADGCGWCRAAVPRLLQGIFFAHVVLGVVEADALSLVFSARDGWRVACCLLGALRRVGDPFVVYTEAVLTARSGPKKCPESPRGRD